MIIVKSKITGKFLRQHSGSATKFRLKTYYEVIEDRSLDLPEDDGSYYVGTTKELNDRQKAIRDEMRRRTFNADATEARRYANSGSALISIGTWAKDCITKKARYVLPDHLELYEIVADNPRLIKL